ncbi:MAG: ATP-binding cassette domain-containing protein, partial [Bacteroidota bacterium]
MSIKVNEITKKYGQQKALDGVSLEIHPGEIVGLLGPNGAGKSTLMKILTCFIPPTSGDAEICGFNILDQSLEVRRRVGYLPENNPLYLDLYVKEFLSFIAGIHQPSTLFNGPSSENVIKPLPGTVKQRIADIIGITGLGNEQHKKIGALSRGYRQRVGIAQALLHDPEVLILDEPTSGLDPNQLVEIRNLIKKIGKEKTVILSTHIMQEVEALCDRTIIIHKGRIVADDLTANIHGTIAPKSIIRVEFSSLVEMKPLTQIQGVEEVIHPSGNKTTEQSVCWNLISDSSQDIRGDVFQFAVEHHL